MSNRLYPSWEHLQASHSPLTAGEKALILFLDENLPDDPTWAKPQPLSEYRGGSFSPSPS